MDKVNKQIYMGIILIALGVVMSGGMNMGPVGIVFIGVGAYFFIAGMAKQKKKQSEEKKAD